MENKDHIEKSHQNCGHDHSHGHSHNHRHSHAHISAPEVTETKRPKKAREAIAYCKRLKEEGNEFFKKKEYDEAITKYAQVDMFAKTLAD